MFRVLFPQRRKRKKPKDMDEVDLLADRIERFAPGKYEAERNQFYYNYRILPLYHRPLINLLETIATREEFTAHPDLFARRLFGCLKAFYDPKDRLSPEEARADREFMRKFRSLFRIFYGIDGPSVQQMDDWAKATDEPD